MIQAIKNVRIFSRTSYFIISFFWGKFVFSHTSPFLPTTIAPNRKGRQQKQIMYLRRRWKKIRFGTGETSSLKGLLTARLSKRWTRMVSLNDFTRVTMIPEISVCDCLSPQ